MPANSESPFMRFPGTRGPVGAGLAGEQRVGKANPVWFRLVRVTRPIPLRPPHRGPSKIPGKVAGYSNARFGILVRPQPCLGSIFQSRGRSKFPKRAVKSPLAFTGNSLCPLCVGRSGVVTGSGQIETPCQHQVAGMAASYGNLSAAAVLIRTGRRIVLPVPTPRDAQV
jgi:hypothetical protein